MFSDAEIESVPIQRRTAAKMSSKKRHVRECPPPSPASSDYTPEMSDNDNHSSGELYTPSGP
jgi:hypothetical protein